MSIAENVMSVKNRMAAALARAGRDSSDAALIAVSKTKPLSDLKEAYDAGCRDFGENRVQEIVQKAPNMPPDCRFHMIGHLQTNKVRQVLPHVMMIHSVDSVKLAGVISTEAVRVGRDIDILLEVNAAGEESKFGLMPEDLSEAVLRISALSNVHIRGLMTVAPFVDDPEENRPVFRKMCQLAVDIKKKNIDNVSMDLLSMGMTGDFEVALEEGAALIRVGTAIFGSR